MNLKFSTPTAERPSVFLAVESLARRADYLHNTLRLNDAALLGALHTANDCAALALPSSFVDELAATLLVAAP